MPAILEDDVPDSMADGGSVATLPFPPVTKKHIMNCSYHSWHPKYARLLKLSHQFALMLTSFPDIAPLHLKRASYLSPSLSSITFAPTALSSRTTTNRAPSQSGQKIAVSFQPRTRTEQSQMTSRRMWQLVGGTFILRYRTLSKRWAEE